jgi:hypothetical protein
MSGVQSERDYSTYYFGKVTQIKSNFNPPHSPDNRLCNLLSAHSLDHQWSTPLIPKTIRTVQLILRLYLTHGQN